MKIDRDTGSWIGLAVLALLLCAATLHGQYLLSHAPEQMGSGYKYVHLSAIGDQAGLSTDTASHEDQAELGLRLPSKSSRIYAAMIKAKGQELEV